MSFIENLDWRYATKKFGRKKLPDDLVEKILHAIRMAPSSFGIQPYHITVVENDQVKKKLNKGAFWDQVQIKTCSHLIIYSVDKDINRRAKEYVLLAGKIGRDDIPDDPEYDYEKGAVEFAEKMGAEWATKQLYIALGFALAACAELKVDSCPMEAVDFVFINESLDLPENLEPKVVLPIGYRDAEDSHAEDKKIRFSREDLFDFQN